MTSLPNVQQLFQSAQQEGLLSQASMQALNIQDLGAQIQAGLGTPLDNYGASEVVLVTIMPDDSGSIRFAGNSATVRAGHNTVVDTLMTCPQREQILIHNRYLNGTVLYPYCPVAQAIRMDQHNYDPNRGTPLYEQTIVLLGTVLAKTQEFADNGIPVRSVTLIISDGADEHSYRKTAEDVKAVVQDMLRTENHIIAAMGIDDGGQTDFRQVFRDMGIREEWILTPGNGQQEITQAFALFSRCAMRVSQSVGNFNQMFLGGFGQP